MAWHAQARIELIDDLRAPPPGSLGSRNAYGTFDQQTPA